MRGTLLSSALLLSLLSAAAQTPNTLPNDLPSLVYSLPDLVRAKQFQLDPYFDAVDAALKRNPTSMADAIPACASNLRDPDPVVRGYTLIVLLGFISRPGGAELIQPLGPEIADAIASEDNREKKAALFLVSSLGPKTPDAVIQPLENLVQLRHKPEKTLAATMKAEALTVEAAGTLMLARPRDNTAQSTILNLINAPDTSRRLRIDLVYSALGAPGAGPAIIDYLTDLINSSDDKELRDAAIEAAGQIGAPAIDPVRDRLRQIERDSSESPESRETAAMALAHAPRETYPMVNGKPAPPEN